MARDLKVVQSEIDAAKAKLDRVQVETDTLTRSADGREFTEGEAERVERLLRGHDAAKADIRRLRDEQRDIIRGVAGNPNNLEAGSTGRSPELMRRVDPWDTSSSDVISRARAAADKLPDIPDEGRERLSTLIDDEQGPTARAILALGNPHYMTAFRAVIKDPAHGYRMWSPAELDAFKEVEIQRTALSLTGANGGFLVPLTLDPTVRLTNAGIAGSIRELATKRVTATNTAEYVTSAGVTAEWTAESAVMADATPTFAQPIITPHKADAWVFGSFEVLGDSNFGDQLSALIVDAKMRLEEAAFATGPGDASNTPWGLITRVTAVTASRVSATTGGTFTASVDIYKVDNAVPPRAAGNPAWMSNKTVINTMRTFPKFTGATDAIVDDTGARPRMLNHPLIECSSMTGTITTGNNILIAGNFLDYYVVDRLGVNLTYAPVVMDQATGRPNGQAGWVAWWRVGGDVINTDSFRVLKL